jgi:hypothetical protein
MLRGFLSIYGAAQCGPRGDPIKNNSLVEVGDWPPPKKAPARMRRGPNSGAEIPFPHARVGNGNRAQPGKHFLSSTCRP